MPPDQRLSVYALRLRFEVNSTRHLSRSESRYTVFRRDDRQPPSRVCRSNLLVLVNLVQTTSTGFASAVIATIPRRTDPVTNVPMLSPWAKSNDLANSLVSRNTWPNQGRELCQGRVRIYRGKAPACTAGPLTRT